MKVRADQLLVQLGLAPTRSQAQNFIMLGLVYNDHERIDKPGQLVNSETPLWVKQKGCEFVSRGGIKLQHALATFGLDITDEIGLDIGSSTGGFVDCQLQHGASRVYAVDVTNHLDYRLRIDPRVIVYGETNFRFFEEVQFNQGKPTFVSIDVSFISLKLIIQRLVTLNLPPHRIVSLIKPQFEAGRSQVGKNGVVRSKEVLVSVLEKVIGEFNELGYTLGNLTFSPIRGKKAGNIEFLAFWQTNSGESASFNLAEIVENAYNYFSEKGKDQC